MFRVTSEAIELSAAPEGLHLHARAELPGDLTLELFSASLEGAEVSERGLLRVPLPLPLGLDVHEEPVYVRSTPALGSPAKLVAALVQLAKLSGMGVDVGQSGGAMWLDKEPSIDGDGGCSDLLSDVDEEIEEEEQSEEEGSDAEEEVVVDAPVDDAEDFGAIPDVADIGM